MCVINWLNTNSGAVQTIATIILAIVTFAYVLLTRSLAKQTRRSAAAAERSADSAERSAAASAELVQESRIARISGTEPQVVPGTVFIRPAPTGTVFAGILVVELENVGPGAAYDVSVNYRLGDWGGTQRLGESLRSQATIPIEAHLVGEPEDPRGLPRETILVITLQYRGIFGRGQRVETRHMVMRGGEGDIPCPMIGYPALSGHTFVTPTQDPT